MKFVAVIVVVVQLIARGASVPHCHVHPTDPEHSDHDSRPHFHLNGHTHSAHDRHKHHAHRHHQHEQNSGLDSADAAPADLPSPHSSDHDEDSVYVNDDALTLANERSEFSQFSDVIWCQTTSISGLSAKYSGRHEHCTWRLPDRYSGILFTLLGHILHI